MNLYPKIKSLYEKNNNLVIISLLLIITLITSSTLIVTNGIPKSHDLLFHLSRISAIKDALVLGQFPIKVYPNYFLGYGYGNGLFYPDLFLYFPAFLSAIGLKVVTSYKIFLIILNLLTAITMYHCLDKITKSKLAAFIGSIVYTLSAYRIVDIYLRGAVGEVLAFVFAPLIILGIYQIIYGEIKEFYYLVIGMSGLILSHLISTYLMAIAIFILCLINLKRFIKEPKRILYLFISAIITLLLTSYFIMPMLEQMVTGQFAFNSIEQTSELAIRTVPLYRIFLGITFNFPGDKWVPAGIGLIFLYFLYLRYQNKKIKNHFMDLCLIMGSIALVCTTKIFPWATFKAILAPIQFPWRLYFLATLFLTIGSSILISKMSVKELITKKRLITISVLAILPAVINIALSFNERTIYEVGTYTASYGEYLPQNIDLNRIQSRGSKIITNNPIYFHYQINGTNINLDIMDNSFSDTYLELPLIYYLGYTAKDHNQNLPVFKTNNGLVGIKLGEMNYGKIKIAYTGTMISIISRYLSLISLIIFIRYLLLSKRNVKNQLIDDGQSNYLDK